MWDGFELPGAVRHEMRGFGQTPMPPAGRYSDADDLIARLDGPAALVGASFGGQVCLEVASRRPDLVTRLVVLDAPLPDHDWSEEIRRYAEHEQELLEQGELRAAAVWNAEFWVRDPALRELVAQMQERAFELQAESEAEAGEPESIDLAAIQARTLVVVGEHDKRDFRDIAERLAAEVPDAQHAVIEGASHLPSLERPEATSALVRKYLGTP
jgi:3-oxoadipate enol-lactonase